MNQLEKLDALARLGLPSLLRVGAYRVRLKTGLHPVQRLRSEPAVGPFFRRANLKTALPEPTRTWQDEIWRFGWHREDLQSSPPDWFLNPFDGGPPPQTECDWWQIPDFGHGDIKGLWELSRFDWVVAGASVAAHGDALALARLNTWLQDWTFKNPPYKGPNWKCGQEASIRVMHLVLAAWLVGQDADAETGLVQLVIDHLKRIAPTMPYAIGQQNNHGTSEAAALFIGGSFLAGHDPRASAWMRHGRSWLEKCAKVLIEPDGSFSQYSVNYHRVMLDTYTLAEAWRRKRQLKQFSEQLMSRLAAATHWLRAMTDQSNGDVPNIGANDGARLIPLTGSDYRDFRPSVQAAAAAFLDETVYGTGPWDDALRWLGISGKSESAPLQSESFDYGGYHILRVGNAVVVLRYPRFRFRPSQADALHLDLWSGGRNLLRDAGTYSYNMPGSDWFSSTAAHNTVEFDSRDQMPRLGRFLFGKWLRAENVEMAHGSAEKVRAAAGYTDYLGARHHRSVFLQRGCLVCVDRIGGDFKQARLRWRLHPGVYRLEGNRVKGNGITVDIDCDEVGAVVQLKDSTESRYYLKKNSVPVIEVTVGGPATVTSTTRF